MFRRCVVGLVVLGAMMAPALVAAADGAKPPAERADSTTTAVLQNELVIRDENLDRQHREIDRLQNRIHGLQGQLFGAEAAVRESHQRHAAFVALVHRVLLYGAVVLTLAVLLSLLLLIRRHKRNIPGTGNGVQESTATDEKQVADHRPEGDDRRDDHELTPVTLASLSPVTVTGLDDLERLFDDKPVRAPSFDDQTGSETKQ